MYDSEQYRGMFYISNTIHELNSSIRAFSSDGTSSPRLIAQLNYKQRRRTAVAIK